MKKCVLRRTLFVAVLLSAVEIFLTTAVSHEDAFAAFLNSLVQPASLEIWTTLTCRGEVGVPAFTSTVRALNATLIYHNDWKLANIERYITSVQLRNLPGYLHRYILIDRCLIGKLYNRLDALVYLFKDTNFIVITEVMLDTVRACPFFCYTIQLVLDFEKNIVLFGLPVESVDRKGCSRWRFYDEFNLTSLGVARFPWLRSTVTPNTSVKNSVVRGVCMFNCKISNTFRILSREYNFTITGCPFPHDSCDFAEISYIRTGLATIAKGYYLPLNTFVSQNFAFVAPKGVLYPKWEYLARPFELSVWLAILSSVATLIIFFVLSVKCQRSTLRKSRKHLWRLGEFLIGSFFAPVPLPRRIEIPAVLLLVWALLMQIPATGFRAVMTSFLNEPPRRKPVSDTWELSAKLGTKSDPMLLCLEDTLELYALCEVYSKKFVTVSDFSDDYADYDAYNRNFYDTFYKIALPKVRHSGCRDYVRNGTGVFFGNENGLIAVVERDTEIAPNQLTRLEFLPGIAFSSYGNPYRITLSKALLRLFESHVEARMNTLRLIKAKSHLSCLNDSSLSPHKVEDLWPFFQCWAFGILIASITLLLERVVSRYQVIFPQSIPSSATIICRSR